MWTAASEQSRGEISKKTFLVEPFLYIIASLNSQSVEGLYHRYFLEKFSKMDGSGRLLLNSARQLLLIHFDFLK